MSCPDTAGTPGDARITVRAEPPWLLAPLFLRDFLRLRPAGPGPGPLFDQPPAERFIDPWLMHSVRPDRAVLLTAAAADWPAWWDQVVDFRPDGTTPRPTDTMAFSPALGDTWLQVEPWFDRWMARRKPSERGPAVEQDLVDELAERNGRLPARRSMTVLAIPVLGSLFIQPEPDRLVVSTGLRRDATRYRDLLEPLLTAYF